MKLRSAALSALLIITVWLNGSPFAGPASPSTGTLLDDLTEGQVVNGFRATALYLDDSDKPFGTRLIHTKTGFTLDYIQIQSVPQVFVWVKSFPTSDRGEPHTQEHLLLGKGNVGRAHASLESMSLV